MAAAPRIEVPVTAAVCLAPGWSCATLNSWGGAGAVGSVGAGGGGGTAAGVGGAAVAPGRGLAGDPGGADPAPGGLKACEKKLVTALMPHPSNVRSHTLGHRVDVGLCRSNRLRVDCIRFRLKASPEPRLRLPDVRQQA